MSSALNPRPASVSTECELVLELRRVQVSGKSLPFRLRLVNMTRWKSLTAGPERAYERVVRA